MSFGCRDDVSFIGGLLKIKALRIPKFRTLGTQVVIPRVLKIKIVLRYSAVIKHFQYRLSML